MRILSSTLKNEQQKGALTPLIKVILTKGITSHTYYKDRILPSEHDEEMYSHRAKIVLSNHDHALDSLDLKGFDAVISYGFGKEYSATSPLSVIDQQFDSDVSKDYPLTCTLFLEGMPNLMIKDEASENYVPDEDDTKTVKDLVNAIIGATLDCFSGCVSYEVVWDEDYDTLADSYKPADGFRVYTGGSRLAALRRVLDFTSNVPRFESDGKCHILRPVTSGTTYDSEYSLERGQHNFFNKAYKDSLVFPNRIIVTSRTDDTPFYQGEAQVDGYDSLPEKVKKTHFVQARLESNDQAEDIAEALIAKAEMGSARGQAEIRINVASEVFDYVRIVDSRQGDTRTGNLGYIHRRFGQDKWIMTFGFGNWLEMLRYQKILKELEVYTGQYFERLSVGDLYVEHIYADSLDMVWIDPEGNIDLSKIGDTLDNLPDGEVYARIKSMHLDAGVLQLDENVVYKAGYDPSTKWTGSDLDDLPDGAVYHRVKSAALTAAGLVLLDQVVVGTYGLVKTTDISAGHILLSTVLQTTGYQTVTNAQKSDWTAKPDTMDEIGEGTTYQRVKTTEIDSGRIRLTLANYYSTKFSGKWYLDGSSSAGVSIAAGVGINIWGRNQALTTRATETGTIQCYVGSDGCIYAGAGAVKLSASGIELTGQQMSLKYGGAIKGWLFGSSTGVALQAVGGADLDLSGAIITIGGSNITLASDHLHLNALQHMELPRLAANPGAKPHGTMIFNSATGYINVYDTVYGGWWHIDRTGGWA